MSLRAVGVVLAAALSVLGRATFLGADQVVTQVFPGITHIARTETSPRPLRMNIVLVDLTAPEVRFKLTPPGSNFPEPVCPLPPWPCPPPPFETVRQSTLAFLEASHAQVAIDSHFFAPFPVANTPQAQAQSAYAYLIGLAASRGIVYSAFETPVQSYAIVTDSPAIHIDASNNAGIVHRDPTDPEGKRVLEGVQLWNALAGSGQIVTNGVKTIPSYKDAAQPDGLLTPGGAPGGTQWSNANSWYNAINARTAIGLTQDARTLVLFTVDVRPSSGPAQSRGMQVGEVADLLIRDYGVWNALNLDGGGSTTMAMEDPVTHVRRVINTPSDNPPRAEGSNFAVYSDGVDPVTTATVAPAPNANGWNTGPVTVTLAATDLASGILDTPLGWVDQLQYALTGAQPADGQVVAGSSASFGVSAEGVTSVSFFATDAAGNHEAAKTLAVRIDTTAPAIHGLPAACSLWPPNNKMVHVATVTATDGGAGIASLEVVATSSEPVGPDGVDVEVASDGSGGYAVWLRAQRLGAGAGRIYTLTATARDFADNVTTASASCLVAHDQRRR